MTAVSMAAFIKARMDAISAHQFSGGGGSSGAIAMADAYLVAFCQGVIDEIQANAVATGQDSGSDTHSLIIS